MGPDESCPRVITVLWKAVQRNPSEKKAARGGGRPSRSSGKNATGGLIAAVPRTCNVGDTTHVATPAARWPQASAFAHNLCGSVKPRAIIRRESPVQFQFRGRGGSVMMWNVIPTQRIAKSTADRWIELPAPDDA